MYPAKSIETVIRNIARLAIEFGQRKDRVYIHWKKNERQIWSEKQTYFPKIILLNVHIFFFLLFCISIFFYSSLFPSSWSSSYILLLSSFFFFSLVHLLTGSSHLFFSLVLLLFNCSPSHSFFFPLGPSSSH